MKDSLVTHDFREIHKKSELKIVKSRYVRGRDFISKMEYYATWLLLRMQGGAVARGHRSCWKQLAKWYQFLEFFLLNC
jgi:hypothetical protein